jgi:hypothetical protein
MTSNHHPPPSINHQSTQYSHHLLPYRYIGQPQEKELSYNDLGYLKPADHTGPGSMRRSVASMSSLAFGGAGEAVNVNDAGARIINPLSPVQSPGRIHPPPFIERQQHLLMVGEEDGAGAGNGDGDENGAPPPLPLDNMLGPMGLETPHPVGGLPKHVRVPGFLTTSAFLRSLPALPGGGNYNPPGGNNNPQQQQQQQPVLGQSGSSMKLPGGGFDVSILL